MQLFCESNQYKLLMGSMLEMDEFVERESIDSIVTDPPYELNFMGKGWDNSGIAFQVETWKKCFDVLKPGGYLLAFGGSRTFHRIACAIEDAGFEIRDTIMWLYGSGFPKSMNIGKSVEAKLLTGSGNKTEFKNLDGTKVKAGGWGINTNVEEQGFRPTNYDLDGHLRTVEVNYQTTEGKQWDGWGTCLKPAYEPIIVARKPCEGSTTDNVLTYGVGGINIDECRVGDEVIVTNGKGGLSNPEIYGNYSKSNDSLNNIHNGRFPANVILTYDETDEQEVCGGFPVGGKNGTVGKPYESTNTVYGKYNGVKPFEAYDDEGSAARYFYCAKASKRDRNEGLDSFKTSTKVFNGQSNTSSQNMKDVEKRFITEGKNTHPTVKPTALMQYLVRLVTPRGGTVLDPFNGSGSTGKATMYENNDRNAGYKYIGIDLSDEYLNISRARIDYAIGDTSELLYDEIPSAVKKSVPKSDFVSLFV